MAAELGAGEVSLGKTIYYDPELERGLRQTGLGDNGSQQGQEAASVEQSTSEEPLIPGLPDAATMAAAVRQLRNPVQRWK